MELNKKESKKTSLWSSEPPKKEHAVRDEESPMMTNHETLAYKAKLDSEVEHRLVKENLDEVVNRVLQKILPPVVEKLVTDRLDKLLAEQDNAVDLK